MPTMLATGERTHTWSLRRRASFCNAWKCSMSRGTRASRGTRTTTAGPGATSTWASRVSRVSPGSTMMTCSSVSTVALLETPFGFGLHLLQALILGQEPFLFCRQGSLLRGDLAFARLAQLRRQRLRLRLQLFRRDHMRGE